MQCKDIPDEHVVDLARRWQEYGRTRPAGFFQLLGEPDPERPLGVVAALIAEGVPEKLAVTKVLSLCRARKRGKLPLLDYGTSPYYAWPCC